MSTSQVLWDALGVPATKAPISSVATIVSYVLPPLFLYFLMAALAITPRTHALRVACWPVLALLALRASVSVDTAPDSFERKFHHDLANPMLMIATRALYWTFTKEPLVRHLRPTHGTPSAFMDVIDLAFAYRGIGWDWSRGLSIPRETRPTHRTGFLLSVTRSAVVHAFICGTTHTALRSFSPAGLGAVPGTSIFDDTLPWHVRYLRSSVISVLGCVATYGLLQTVYDASTLVGILVLGQDPAQWPPGFDSPWRSTSLAEFWGRRWHQWLRHMFLVQGGYPLSFLFGRTGFVVGAFLGSALYHQVGLGSLDAGSEPWRMFVGFGMMAPGMLAERAFARTTGRRVCGLAGWVWTASWLLLWGNVIVDGFVRVGLFRAGSLIDGVPPWKALVERGATGVDGWLRAV